MPYSSRSADKFVVRLPEGMRERIAEVARNYHRSMNSEIISRLENSLYRDDAVPAVVKNLDSKELTHSEQLLVQNFRRLAQHQQSALLALINNDKK